MQKTLSKFILFILLGAFIWSSCTKNGTSSLSKTTLITTGSWKFSTATVAGVDASSQIPACYKDNIITFVSNGTATINEGTTVCSPSTAGAYTWSFQNNETKLNMSGNLIPGGNGNFTIVALNETTLSLSQETTLIPSPTPLTITITFIH